MVPDPGDRPRHLSLAVSQPNRRRSTLLTGLLQPSHLIIILIIALVFLGPKRIPEAGRALGQGLKEFKGSISGGTEEHQQVADQPAAVDDETASVR
ncbi:MAG: twin-arginine translocase TatA/TatE family subunit [Solirubrobacterales bacterium]|nr:twin-arginine translocase TatA/TatE family subunit [Solirubrobacterales bacterium]